MKLEIGSTDTCPIQRFPQLTVLLTLIDMLLHGDKAKSGFSLMVMSSQNHSTSEQIHLLAYMVIILTIMMYRAVCVFRLDICIKSQMVLFYIML